MMISNDNILMINNTDTDKKKIRGPFLPIRLYENGHCLFSLI